RRGARNRRGRGHRIRHRLPARGRDGRGSLRLGPLRL
ncbi:MAG: hypothetical protein AVDCRST_MAG05-5137, partial [uncultured Rubrobacteraceae bacterium]